MIEKPLNSRGKAQGPLIVAIIFEGGMGVLAVILGWFFSMRIISKIVWDLRLFLFSIAIALPLSVTVTLLVHIPIESFKKIRKLLVDYFVPMFSGLSILDLFLMAMLSGVGEELLFRGFLQGIADEYMGAAFSVILTNIIFGAAHFVTPVYGVITFLLGCLLGASMVYTENLMVPIVIHGFYNFVSFIYLIKILARKGDSTNEST